MTQGAPDAGGTSGPKDVELAALLQEGRGSQRCGRLDAPPSAGGRLHKSAVVISAIGAAVALTAIAAFAAGRSGLAGVGCRTFPSLSACIANRELLLSEARPTYTIMIDCGSSGTRLKLFKQDGKKIEGVKLKEDIEMGALTSYVGRLGKLDADLERMIKMSKQYVPEESWRQTPLYMYATAGMRVLPAEDQSAVFARCRDKLSDKGVSPYAFEDARTLSGEMEAAFQYLSVNYVKSGGQKFPDETVGQIEMGGASLQVAFNPKDDVLDNSWVYELFGKRETIYAKSFMGFGQNVARLKTQEAAVLAAQERRLGAARLSQQNNTRALAGTVTYPCFLKGYSEDVTMFEDTPGQKPRVVTLTGSSDFKGCLELTKKILHTDYECDLPPCTIRGTYMTKLTGKFVGISGFKFALLNLGLKLGSTTPGMLRDAVEKFCGQSFADLGGNTKFTKYECFLGNYAYSMLMGLGFKDNDETVSFAGDYSWTLGAVVYEALGDASAPPTGRRLLELPGVQSVPHMDHECYWDCRSQQRCAELSADLGGRCKQACSASCAA